MWLILILLASAIVRIVLAYQGGQYYWPDEQRYGIARDALQSAFAGDWDDVKRRMLGTSDHLFFRYISLLPALLDRWFVPANAPSPPFAAACLSLFGVGTVLLVWLIMRDALRDEAAATWGALFYAGCVTAFFFSRHYFPYDTALCLLLAGWWWGRRGDTAARDWATGLLVGLGYLTYNAYWNVGAVILLFHVLRAPLGWPGLLRRGCCTFAGLVTPVLALFGTAWLLGFDLLAHAQDFSRTVTQGDFGRGWWLILSYFAAAERGYLVLLLGVIVSGLLAALRHREPLPGWSWALMGAVLAAEMVLLSDVIERFALSGRMVKPLMIFAALVAGATAARLTRARPMWMRIALASVAVVLAGTNFATPLRLRFPSEFKREAQAIGAQVLTDEPDALLQLYYTDFMHRPNFIPTFPPHIELLRRMHPVQYRPYQFEGYDEAMRAAFCANDFAMRLVRVTEAVSWHADASQLGTDLAAATGALEIELQLPAARPVGQVEPLVVAGIPGAADLVSVRYADAEQIEIMVDHWGWGLVRSQPFAVPDKPARTHRVVLSAGAWLPQPDLPAMRADPDLTLLTERVIVSWNGRTVLNEKIPVNHVPLSQVVVGSNFIGGTTSGLAFTGKIIRVQRVDPRWVMRRDWAVEAPEWEPAGGWAEEPGPLDVRFKFDPALAIGPIDRLPVFSARRGPYQLEATMRCSEHGVSFTLWHQGEAIADSPLMPLAAGEHRMQLWIPLLMPATEQVEPNERVLAAWAGGNFVMQLDGRVVLQAAVPAAMATMPELGKAKAPLTSARIVLGRESPQGGQARHRAFPGPFEHVAPASRAGSALLQAMWAGRIFGTQLAPDAVGPLRLWVKFPRERRAGAEPLLTTGRTGQADIVFVAYEPDGRIRIGHDHWGWALLRSTPVALDRKQEHVIDLSLGPLYPRQFTPWAETTPDGSSRKCRVYVAIDGVPVLSADSEYYFSAPAELSVGGSYVGASTAEPSFTGEIRRIEFLRPEELPPASHLGGSVTMEERVSSQSFHR